jgi:hypothetical protein
MAFAKQPAWLRQHNLNRSRKHHLGQQHSVTAADRPPLDTAKAAPLSEPNDKAATGMSHERRRQPVWLLLAMASGSCAAFNGVFAKL